jgi:hypothetical protein
MVFGLVGAILLFCGWRAGGLTSTQASQFACNSSVAAIMPLITMYDSTASTKLVLRDLMLLFCVVYFLLIAPVACSKARHAHTRNTIVIPSSPACPPLGSLDCLVAFALDREALSRL